MADQEADTESWADWERKTVHCRSQAAVVHKSLQERCMENILENAVLLKRRPATRQQFANIPPLLRRDFVRRMRSWDDDRHKWLTERELDRVLSLAQLLLDHSITEFDMATYGGGNKERNRDKWRLLADKCPDLERVSQNTFQGNSYYLVPLEGVMPELLKLRKLEHVLLRECIVKSSQALAQLLDAFPNLRSLCLSSSYKLVEPELLEKLFKLQKLEVLWISLDLNYEESQDNKAKDVDNTLMAECLGRLPLLQEVYVRFDREEVYHNAKHEPERPLALRSVRVKGGLNGWTRDVLPDVTKIHIQGPLEGLNDLIGFKNLTNASFYNVSLDSIREILGICGGGMEELAVSCDWVWSYSFSEYNELFTLCPNLRTFNIDSEYLGDDTYDVHPLSSENLRRLRNVLLCRSKDTQDSTEMLFKILMAPGIEKLTVYPFALDADQVLELNGMLLRREILQNLREFEVLIDRVPKDSEEQFFLFFKLLVAFAPKLRMFYCRVKRYKDLYEHIEPFGRYDVPGLVVRVSETY